MCHRHGDWAVPYMARASSSLQPIVIKRSNAILSHTMPTEKYVGEKKLRNIGVVPSTTWRCEDGKTAPGAKQPSADKKNQETVQQKNPQNCTALSDVIVWNGQRFLFFRSEARNSTTQARSVTTQPEKLSVHNWSSDKYCRIRI